VLALALCASAHGGLYTFNYGVNQVIPDNSIIGLTESQTISGLNAPITDLQVSLNISGGFNGDLYGYLRLNNSPLVVLVNCVGETASNPYGYANAGMLVTLTSSPTAQDIHFYQNYSPVYNSSGQLTGTWQADGRANPLDTARGSLSQFNGLDPNGTWTLFFAEPSAGFPSTLVSWSLDITTVPEPVTVALAVFGALAAAIKLLAWRRLRA
jgi:subtilisin-like proprotein convertase family protein